MKDEKAMIPFNIILHAGNAKSMAMEALYKGRDNELEEAENILEKAQKELVEAHKCQTQLLQGEAREEGCEMNVLLCHSMDHIVMASSTIEMAEEIIMLRKEIAELKKQGG